MNLKNRSAKQYSITYTHIYTDGISRRRTPSKRPVATFRIKIKQSNNNNNNNNHPLKFFIYMLTPEPSGKHNRNKLINQLIKVLE
jgi:hypothetical protein